MTDDQLLERVRFAIAAQIMDQSCESCEKREFDFLIHGTLVCESCSI